MDSFFKLIKNNEPVTNFEVGPVNPPTESTAPSKPNPADDLRYSSPTKPSDDKLNKTIISEVKEIEDAQAARSRDGLDRPATIIVDTMGEKETAKEGYNFSYFPETMIDDDPVDTMDKNKDPNYSDFDKLVEENYDKNDFLN